MVKHIAKYFTYILDTQNKYILRRLLLIIFFVIHPVQTQTFSLTECVPLRWRSQIQCPYNRSIFDIPLWFISGYIFLFYINKYVFNSQLGISIDAGNTYIIPIFVTIIIVSWRRRLLLSTTRCSFLVTVVIFGLSCARLNSIFIAIKRSTIVTRRNMKLCDDKKMTIIKNNESGRLYSYYKQKKNAYLVFFFVEHMHTIKRAYFFLFVGKILSAFHQMGLETKFQNLMGLVVWARHNRIEAW